VTLYNEGEVSSSKKFKGFFLSLPEDVLLALMKR